MTKMKKSLLLLLFLLMFPLPAAAEIVGTTPQSEYIHRYIAPNGQEIYYVSHEDEWATVQQKDVNFDGHDDLVFLITLGASNGFFEFYVWDDGQYVLAGRNALHGDGLPNFELHPDLGLVSTYHQIGWAGLLHEKHIFRWKENNLELVRYAVSQNLKTSVFEDEVFVTIENNDQIHVRIFECRYDEDERTDEVIFEQLVSQKEGFDEHSLLQEESAALWNGIK